MPIYAYRCAACGHELDKLQKMSAEPLTDCPECGKPALKRKVTAAAFRLSGGGWYETDFKKEGKKNLAGDSGSSGKDGDTAKNSSSNDAGSSTGKTDPSSASNSKPAASKPASS